MTRKITQAFARIKLGLQEKVSLGNLDAKRDWGFAGDYIEAMWLMLQQDEPDDYVICPGKNHSVRDFIEAAVKCIGIEIEWKGTGVDEKGIDKKTGKVVEINPKYFRPADVDLLLGDYSKANKKFGWKPKVSFEQLVKMMVEED